MFRQDGPRKRAFGESRKRHFANDPQALKDSGYPHRLSFYTSPPTAEVTLDQFEQWAIDRLRILGEIESCQFRNKSPAELKTMLDEMCRKHMPLDSNSASSPQLVEQRRKDHYSHFILRLAFARSEELRRRFSKVESTLFKYRFETDDGNERAQFVASLGLDWEPVGKEEKAEVEPKLKAAGGMKIVEEGYYKVAWGRVTDLVEQRKVFVRGGKAYVPASLQGSLVVANFTARLDKALELTARALPRLDEDDRLIPILNHLSQGFAAPEYNASMTPTTLSGEALTAASVDSLAPHFPACMTHLHTSLRRDKHLKHFGRLQYTLFLKGIGLSIDECLIFWRTAFSNVSEDKFNKDYRYNVRHTYGLEGNRRNYRPHSCQQILTGTPPSTGDAHGCPYRHFAMDNLREFLQSRMGVSDGEVLKQVQEDVRNKKFHIGCNRVFEWKHKEEIKREGGGLETIIHPNEYFVRSWELTHPEAKSAVGGGAGTRRGGQVKDEEGDIPMI